MVFHPKELQEFRESFLWYNEQQKGLGNRFEAAIENLLSKKEAHPEYYSETRNGFRQANTEVFPFLIIYKAIPRQAVIYVASILHTDRNPKGKFRSQPK